MHNEHNTGLSHEINWAENNKLLSNNVSRTAVVCSTYYVSEMALYVKKYFPLFSVEIFPEFFLNLTEPETFPTNAKPWKSVCAFWSYSVRKENSTYFYIAVITTTITEELLFQEATTTIFSFMLVVWGSGLKHLEKRLFYYLDT